MPAVEVVKARRPRGSRSPTIAATCDNEVPVVAPAPGCRRMERLLSAPASVVLAPSPGLIPTTILAGEDSNTPTDCVTASRPAQVSSPGQPASRLGVALSDYGAAAARLHRPGRPREHLDRV